MRTIVQKVTRGAVTVDGDVVGAIGRGAVLLVGVEAGDTEREAIATAEKIAKMRIFEGSTPTDHSLLDVGGGCLVISQFTLAANLRKGNRPSFTRAMDPADAERLYLEVAHRLAELGLETATGSFGAEMQVELVNDGPMTFVVDCREGRIG